MAVEAIERLLRDRRLMRGVTLEKQEAGSKKQEEGQPEGCTPNVGGVQEFFLVDDLPTMGGRWGAPLVAMLAASGPLEGRAPNTVWIGKRCWPTFQVIVGAIGQEGLKRSVFLDPLTDEDRFWAIGQALRCRGVGVVIADGSGMNETVSRRMQLAAECGGVRGLLARPAWEMGASSWARGRWTVRPLAGEVMRWEIERVGGRGEAESPASWIAEWSYENFIHGRMKPQREVQYGAGAVRVFAGMGRGTDPAAMAPGRRTA